MSIAPSRASVNMKSMNVSSKSNLNQAILETASFTQESSNYANSRRNTLNKITMKTAGMTENSNKVLLQQNPKINFRFDSEIKQPSAMRGKHIDQLNFSSIVSESQYMKTRKLKNLPSTEANEFMINDLGQQIDLYGYTIEDIMKNGYFDEVMSQKFKD